MLSRLQRHGDLETSSEVVQHQEQQRHESCWRGNSQRRRAQEGRRWAPELESGSFSVRSGCDVDDLRRPLRRGVRRRALLGAGAFHAPNHRARLVAACQQGWSS